MVEVCLLFIPTYACRLNLTHRTPATLIFELTEVSLGGGWDPGHGVFTAPHPGLYSFSWSALVAGRWAWYPLRQGGYSGEKSTLPHH